MIARSHSTVDKVFGWKVLLNEIIWGVAGSIPTTGKNNKEYLLSHNICTQLWVTELEQSTPVVQRKRSVQDSVWTPEFDMKHLKKAEEHISQNVVSITINMSSIVQIF